mgnify:CR=1 FL=1
MRAAEETSAACALVARVVSVLVAVSCTALPPSRTAPVPSVAVVAALLTATASVPAWTSVVWVAAAEAARSPARVRCASGATPADAASDVRASALPPVTATASLAAAARVPPVPVDTAAVPPSVALVVLVRTAVAAPPAPTR